MLGFTHRNLCRLLFASLLVVIPSVMQAQDNSSGKISLSTLLRQLEEKHEVTFSYNPRLLERVLIDAPAPELSLNKVLDHIRRSAPIDIENAGSSSILIIPIRSTLKFRVEDNNDGNPLQLIYITVNQNKQTYLIAKDGDFLLENAFPTDSLEISTSFYHPVRLTVADIAAGNNLVKLNQEITNLGEVTVLSYLTSGVNTKLSDHSMEIDMSNLGLIAGETDGDILQVLQAIPGIRSPDGKPGTLNLRGSPFDQNLTYFDNIPIYHSGHFFGTFSPYNPAIVEKITVQRGVLPAQYGGRVGGLINIQSSNKVAERFTGSVIANSVFGGIEFKLPIIPNKLSFLLSGRANYPINALSPKLEAYYDLNFQGSLISPGVTDSGANLDLLKIRFNDINSKLIYEISQRHKLSLSFLSIGNNFEFRFDSPNQNQVNTELSELDNWGMTGQWQTKISDRVEASASLTTSSLKIFENRQEFDGNRLESNTTVENVIDDFRFSTQLNIQLADQTKALIGYELTDHDLSFLELRGTPVQQPQNQLMTQGTINSFHLNLEQRIKDRFIANLGLRSDSYSADNDQHFLDPRVSLTYLASKSVYLKASGGRAHQYIKQNFATDFDDFRISNEFWILANRNVPVLESTQFMVGAMIDKSSWLFDVEFYSKQIDNISRPGNQNDPLVFGSLDIIGADFLIKKRWQAVETWLSYTLGQTKERFREEQEAHYDQRHVLNIKVIVPIDRWNIAASWGYRTGLPVYLPDPDEVNGPGNQMLNIPYNGRFPAQHQLDISTTFRFTGQDSKYKGVIGLSILNLYNRNNVINVFQENVMVNSPIRYGLGFSPNLQIKISF